MKLLKKQRLALIRQHRHADGNLYSETLLAAQIEEADFSLSKIWKVIFNLLGIDFDKLPADEQKVLKKVLAKSLVIKNNPLNFRRRRK